ncbi:MAG: Spy/CpxP family protein refolding chaperone [Hyalangium sp.]|uniref:Spy/CpxP family protein refolding chaperone n=1 Tax=Hyalangium sp. TaxID=2028555 RepID=UPI00389994B6
MRRHLVTLCVLFPLITLAQSQGAAGQQPPPPGHPPFAQKTWVQVLLEHRQELALTDAQVAGMERIDKALAEKNAPVKSALEQLRPQHPGPMGPGMGGPMPQDAKGGGEPAANRPSEQEMRAHFEQARGLMDQLKANDDAAYNEAEALLNDAQKKTAHQLVSAEAEVREKRRQEMHQRMREHMGNGGGGSL